MFTATSLPARGWRCCTSMQTPTDWLRLANNCHLIYTQRQTPNSLCWWVQITCGVSLCNRGHDSTGSICGYIPIWKQGCWALTSFCERISIFKQRSSGWTLNVSIMDVNFRLWRCQQTCNFLWFLAVQLNLNSVKLKQLHQSALYCKVIQQ